MNTEPANSSQWCLQLGDREERVERLRQTRQEIFEAEYAHLYRGL